MDRVLGSLTLPFALNGYEADVRLSSAVPLLLGG
jgi:hypothetical protein